jgi:hypothetical protein
MIRSASPLTASHFPKVKRMGANGNRARMSFVN